MNPETIVLGILAAAGSIGTVWLGVMKAREDRAVRLDSAARQDRVDVLTVVTSDRDFWRTEAIKERERADRTQLELFRVVSDADHVADVAQAALLAYRTGTGKVGVVDDTG